MSNYPPDPGGVFASDYHRRVMAHMPLPTEDAITVDDLLLRLHSDAHTGLWYSDDDRDALVRILDDLQESGDAKYLDGTAGWRMAKGGLAKLQGPALTELNTPEKLRAEVAANLEATGDEPTGDEPVSDADVDAAIAAGEKAGTILVAETTADPETGEEKPVLMRFEALPLVGRRLEEMEAHDVRLAAKEDEIEKRAREKAVEVAREQLAEAEAALAEVAA